MSSAANNRGVPIPSFGAVNVSPSMNEPSNGGESVTTTEATKGSLSTAGATKSSVLVTPANSLAIPAHWKVESLVQLEVSLQFWFRKQKSQPMTLDDFYDLVKKIDWNQTKEGNEIPRGKEEHAHDRQIRDLTEEERLLHDLICVGANPANSTQPLYKLKEERGVSLESIPHKVEQLKRLLSSTPTFDKAWSDRIRAMIISHRRHKDEKMAGKKKGDNAKGEETLRVALPQAVITGDMTVDDRVRARAKAKEQREELLKEPSKSNGRKESDVDHTWMIQLADALWTHARNILQRQNYRLPGKLASNSLLHPQASKRQRTTAKTSSSSRCAMTFGDAIQMIAKSRLGEASASQIAKALTELEKYEPRWIIVIRNPINDNNKKDRSSSNTNSMSKSFKWCKTTTTIFITPDNYPAVRSQLTGTPMPVTSGKIVTVDKAAPREAKSAEKTATTESNNRKRPSPVSLFQEGTATNSADNSKRIKTDDGDLKASSSENKSPFAALSSTAKSPLLSPIVKKRERDNTNIGLAGAATAAPPSSPKSPGSPKRKKRLRINPNFILNDSDYVGGEVLPTSMLDAASPRGLKRLFLQLNAGKRI